MGRVAEALREWDEEAKLSWGRRDAALAWAEGQGDDMRAAWETCPRGDDLMVMAGILQAPMRRAIAVTGTLVRPALALTTKKDALATRAVYLAETWGGAAERAVKSASDQLQAHMGRTGARYHESRERLTDASVAAISGLVRAEVATHEDRLRGLAASDDVPWMDIEVARMLEDPASVLRLRAFGAQVQTAQREMARVTALAASIELCRAVESAYVTLRAFATLTRLDEDAPGGLDADLVNKLAESAVLAERETYTLLSGALGMTAEAFGRDAVSRWSGEDRVDGFVTAAARSVFETAAHGLARPDEPLTTLTIHVEIERSIHGERTRRLRAMADAIRAQVPYEALAQRERYE